MNRKNNGKSVSSPEALRYVRKRRQEYPRPSFEAIASELMELGFEGERKAAIGAMTVRHNYYKHKTVPTGPTPQPPTGRGFVQVREPESSNSYENEIALIRHTLKMPMSDKQKLEYIASIVNR